LPRIIQDARLHVAVAVISDKNGSVLLSQRHQNVHQGRLWEFPGGKVELGETVEQALVRELDEELRLTVTKARPLIRIPYDYPDKSVLLDVWMVTDYVGEPVGAEGQPVKWISLDELHEIKMPAANSAIVKACKLPYIYMITPDPGNSDSCWPDFLQQLEHSVATGINLLQFRAKSLNLSQYTELAKDVISLCHRAGCKVVINVDDSLVELADADGVHMSSARLLRQNNRITSDDKLCVASCHNLNELRHANNINCDFAVLGPVNKTMSHPDANPMGWDKFGQLCDESIIPVYALGGMSERDLISAWQNGAQGISGISGFWQYN
jgi:8-oxo-dGTP diphosphatase